MNLVTPCIAILAAAASALGPALAPVQAAQGTLETVQTSHFVIRPGTPEHRELSRFLGQAQVPGSPGARYYDPGSTDAAFLVWHARTAKTPLTASSPGIPAPEPPGPLPGRGHPGDTYKVEHCANRVMQTWTFTWGQITAGQWGWITTSYSTGFVARCAPVPPPL